MPSRDVYRRANRKIRTLTNNPNRESRPGFKPRLRNAIEGKRGITRLIKRDPAKGLQLPSTDKMTDQHVGTGVGTFGVPSPTTAIKSDKTPAANKGKSVIRPARVPLKKR